METLHETQGCAVSIEAIRQPWENASQIYGVVALQGLFAASSTTKRACRLAAPPLPTLRLARPCMIPTRYSRRHM